MSELRSTSDRTGGARARGPEVFDHDLEALRGLSDQALPDLETSLRAARSRASGERRKGLTTMIGFLKDRPMLATALGVLCVAAALLVIPFSYERTVGYDFALALQGGNVAQPQVREIARSFQSTLGAANATVTAAMENGHLTYTLSASATRDVRGVAAAFARGLTNLGYDAQLTATPRREIVSSNVYAYAMSRAIEISMDGKSSAQLESEIRSRLLAAGVTQAQVSVTNVGEHGREIRINAEHTGPRAGALAEEIPDVVLTRDGKPVDAGLAVRIMKTKDATGATTLTVAVTADGRATTVEIPNAGARGDAALAAEIRSRLLQAGIDAVVTVRGDQISVEKRKP